MSGVFGSTSVTTWPRASSAATVAASTPSDSILTGPSGRPGTLGLRHEARAVDRRLRVEAVVHQPLDQLDHRLRLAVATHRAEGDLGNAVAQQHAWHERVQRSRAWRSAFGCAGSSQK